MQQIYANLYPSTYKIYEAVNTYQTGVSLLLMKLYTNPLLPEVHNNIVTRFFTESAEVFLEKTNQLLERNSSSYNAVDIFKDSYSQMLKISHDYFDAWQKGTSDFMKHLTSSNDPVIKKDITHDLQSYYRDVLNIMEQNVSKTIDDVVGNEKNKHTLQFIWGEFKKLFNQKNLPFLNEEIISNPECFLKGANMFLDDIKNSPDGYFLINTVDRSAFEIGKTIAATKGKVVYRNELIELICYESSTENIHKVPVLIVTAWINKYYILDLNPQYSYVRWLIDNGYRVYMISWINPDASMANKSLTNYMQEGLIEAINQVKTISHNEEVNCIGYCMGGTLLSISASYLASKGDKSIKSITLLTTLTDFNRCGPVKMFITDEMLDSIDHYMKRQGYISGYDMFNTFSIIRSNDMIWYYFINKYILGKKPKSIDVLYWNSDSTRIPYSLHSQCLRDLYQNNLLTQGELKFNNKKINLGDVKCPVYCFATEDDHIAPWESVYKGFRLFNASNKRFILSKSGHVAAVINHPDKNKYGYWFDQIEQKKQKKFSDLPNQWFNDAQYKDGSWWNDWNKWMINSNLNGDSVKSSPIASNHIIENAPGSYVHTR